MHDAAPRPPQDYPWPEALPPLAVLGAGGAAEPAADLPAAEAALSRLGGEGLEGRHLVLAVGSNRNPRVIIAKYARAGLLQDAQAATVLVTAHVSGLAVGHSAHASVPGYVPAAPFAAPGVRTEVTGLWVTTEQREAIDVTEPNYVRLTLPADRFPIELAAGVAPAVVEVYASLHGVIGRLRPLPLHVSQQELFDRLAALVDPDPFEGDAAEVCARLAADPEDARSLLASHGLDLPDSLPRT